MTASLGSLCNWDDETLYVVKNDRVTWQNTDEYREPPGDTINMDEILSIKRIGLQSAPFLTLEPTENHAASQIKLMDKSK